MKSGHPSAPAGPPAPPGSIGQPGSTQPFGERQPQEGDHPSVWRRWFTLARVWLPQGSAVVIIVGALLGGLWGIYKLIDAIGGFGDAMQQHEEHFDDKIDAQSTLFTEKIESQGRLLTEKIESQGRLLTEKIERVNDRVETVDDKIDRVERKLETRLAVEDDEGPGKSLPVSVEELLEI